MMEQEIVVSIYVVTYNQEKYLRNCLDGIVMQQTNFKFEAIVIDDASTDENPEIIKEYAERYPEIIKPVLLEENLWSQGINKFFAVFLPRAKGKYIAFCEGDDYWTFEGKLQRQVDFLESHPDYSMCFHNYKVKNETDLKYWYRGLIKSRDVGVEDIILCQVVQEATVLSRRTSIEKDIELKADILSKKFQFSDIRFYLSYIHTGKVYGIAEKWSVYRVQNKGVSTKTIINGTCVEIHKQILSNLLKCYGGKFEFLKRHIHVRELMNESSIRVKKGDILGGIKLKLKAFLLFPILFLKLYFEKYISKKEDYIEHISVDSNNCKISIVIPAYNADKWIICAINSVLNQSFYNIELIIVNDGSTDNTSQIIQRYKNDCRVKIIDRKENKGSIYSRIEGFEASNGKYIYFMDADDKLSVDALSIMYNEAQENDSDIVIMGAYLWLSKIGKRIRMYIPSQNFEIPKQNISQFMYESLYGYASLLNPLWNKLISRKVCNFLELKKIENIFLGEDVVISLEIFKNVKKITYTDYIGIYWRSGGGSINWQSQKWNDYKKLVDYMYNKIEMLEIDEFFKNKLRLNLFNSCIYSFICNIKQRLWSNYFFNKDLEEYISNELRDTFWTKIKENFYLLDSKIDNLDPKNLIKAAKKDLSKHFINELINILASVF